MHLEYSSTRAIIWRIWFTCNKSFAEKEFWMSNYNDLKTQFLNPDCLSFWSLARRGEDQHWFSRIGRTAGLDFSLNLNYRRHRDNYGQCHECVALSLPGSCHHTAAIQVFHSAALYAEPFRIQGRVYQTCHVGRLQSQGGLLSLIDFCQVRCHDEHYTGMSSTLSTLFLWRGIVKDKPLSWSIIMSKIKPQSQSVQGSS